MTPDGMVARSNDDKPPRLSGSEAPKLLVKANSTDTLYMVSGAGMCSAVAVHTLPEAEKLADGNPFNKSPPPGRRDACSRFQLASPKIRFARRTYLFTATCGGMVKKSALADFPVLRLKPSGWSM